MLGLLLIVTGGLKIYALNSSVTPNTGWFAQPWVLLATGEWEIILGAWLLSGSTRRLSWLAAVLTVTAFAAVSGYLSWVGVASCGCLGPIKANPWWTFGLDVGVLAFLAMSFPKQDRFSSPSFARSVGIWLAGVMVLLAILIAGGSFYFGSYRALIAGLRGEPVTTSVGYVDFGTCQAGEDLEAPITFSNWTPKVVRLIGGTSDCNCTTLKDLPVEIKPGVDCEIRVRLHTPNSSHGYLSRVIVVMTDCPERPRVAFRIGCLVK